MVVTGDSRKKEMVILPSSAKIVALLFNVRTISIDCGEFVIVNAVKVDLRRSMRG